MQTSRDKDEEAARRGQLPADGEQDPAHQEASKAGALIRKAANLLFEEIETDLIEKEKFVLEQTKKLKDMHDNFNSLVEYKNVLGKAAEIIGGRVSTLNQVDEESKGPGSRYGGGGGGSLNTEEALLKGNEVRVGHIAGTIGQDEQMRFKKLIFRATRGKVKAS